MKTMFLKFGYLFGIFLATVMQAAAAADFKWGEEVTAKVSAITTAGMMIRAESAAPAVLGIISNAKLPDWISNLVWQKCA